MKKSFWKILLTVCVISFLVSACTTSVIMKDNPRFATDSSKEFAMVYVMRPTLQRTRGIADNDLTIEFGQNQVVTLLSAGEYVAFKVKPGPMDVITRNETYLTGKPDPKNVWRARNFTFKSGQNHFIEAKFTQEEFRGIYFIPLEVNLTRVKSIENHMKAAGDIAKANPLSKL